MTQHDFHKQARPSVKMAISATALVPLEINEMR